ncbi:hypothetical protein TRSC58_04470 [Trypanosoma rangeli SC58]|uniref:C2 domain-containing protein n=1 Tax=Trypanosoma rangeli SC58 TaxID=429131 RepID=A0A061J3F2_TRYRA|nr:hypothetical protein TRSC58_04470 [Trypanosoma rangeli SC58]
MELRLIGLRNFTPACACYVKVYLNGESVLRSSQQSGAVNITFAPSDAKNATVVTLDDPQHARLRVKVAQYRYFQSATISFAEVRLRNMVARCLNEHWFPLFDSDGEEIGRIGIALKCNGFIGLEVAPVKLEAAEKDVVSLLRKYKREALPFLQPLMTEAGSAAAVHAEIRRRVATRPVAATVYVCVESLSFTEPGVFYDQRHTSMTPLPQENERSDYTVTANCDHEEATVSWSEQLQGSSADIRLDIPEFGKCGDHRLIITVRQARGARSLSRAGKKPRSSSRGSRANSPQQATHPLQVLPPTELGRVVVSLRALLTRSLYDAAERVTLPLVSFTQNPSDMRSLQQQQQQQQQQQLRSSAAVLPLCTVVGTVSFSVRLPAFEQVPSWLQLHNSDMEKHSAINRACIRHYEGQICEILAKHEPQTLLDLHYTLYERDVAHGQWSVSLRDWKRVLLQRIGAVEDTPDVFSPPLCVKNFKDGVSEQEAAEAGRHSKKRNGDMKLYETMEKLRHPSRVHRTLYMDSDGSTPL